MPGEAGSKKSHVSCPWWTDHPVLTDFTVVNAAGQQVEGRGSLGGLAMTRQPRMAAIMVRRKAGPSQPLPVQYQGSQNHPGIERVRLTDGNLLGAEGADRQLSRMSFPSVRRLSGLRRAFGSIAGFEGL